MRSKFSFAIVATGLHGCQREIGDGKIVVPCENPNCPDCQCRALVARLRSIGIAIESAVLTHWPGESGAVDDDLATGVRSGDF